MTVASTIVWLATAWIYAGTAVAMLFLIIGIDRIDKDAQNSYTFRPLLVPGIIILWPLIITRWLQLESGVDADRNRDRAIRSAHGWVWAILAIVIPSIVIGAVLIRQTPIAGEPAVQLTNPQQ